MQLFYNPSIEIIKEIVTDKDLWYLNIGKDEGRDTWEPNLCTTVYIAGILQDQIIGLFEMRPVTDYILEVHLLVKKEFWGKGIAEPFMHEMYQYVKNNTKFTNLTTTSPAPCKHVQRYLTKFGFENTHTYKDGILYQGKLEDFKVYTHYIKRA